MKTADRSIVLIGFMGTGKSSVGRRLATRRGWPNLDTDAMIATSLGMRITEIFDRIGQEQFRAKESAILEEIDTAQPAVIVTGGGAILRPGNVARLRELGTVVCLTADLDTLL
jgi:shikimate kinase